jgi:hypothetical protein
MKVSQQQYGLPMRIDVSQLNQCEQEDTVIAKIKLFNKVINSISHRRYVYNKSYMRRGGNNRRSKLFIAQFAYLQPVNYSPYLHTSSSIVI